MNNLKIKTLYPFSATWLDYPDAESYAVYVSSIGCNLNCGGCHNQILHDYKADEKNEFIKTKTFTLKEFQSELLDVCYRNKTNKVVLGGADFLYRENIDFTRQFIKSYGNVYKICLYTGYTADQVKAKDIKGFTFLKCGAYTEKFKQEPIKTDNYIQLASTNQEIYDSRFNCLSRNGRMQF